MAAQKGGAKPADPTGRESADAMSRMKNFAEDMTKNIISYVDKNYRTIPNKDNRAIGGFSRGGGQTLRAGFGNMDKFAWICCYSAYLSTPEMETGFRDIYEKPALTN